jgi:complement component 6
LETDFYRDLIDLGKNEDQQSSLLGAEKSSFHVPIFYSSKKAESVTRNSAFKQAIQASHQKVIKMIPKLFILYLMINTNEAIKQQF